MENEIVKVNPNEFGIEENKAKELYGNLPQIISERSELEKQFDEVIKLDVHSPETWVKARELRLLIQKNRTKGIIAWHKAAKDYFLKGGQFVDAIKRKEAIVNERMESDLEEIEKYEQIQEQKRLEELQRTRAEKLSKYVEDAHERNLSDMDEDVWKAYFQTKKKEHEDRIAAEKKAEAERKEKERKEKLRKERTDLIMPYYDFFPDVDLTEIDKSEFDKHLNEAKAKKEAHLKEQERIRKENERLEKEREAEREKAEAERKAREEKERKEKAEYEEKLRKEREERERYQKELEAKADAERKAKAEAAAQKEAELKKDDQAKVTDLKNDLIALKAKYTFKSKKNKDMYTGVGQLIDKIVNYIDK